MLRSFKHIRDLTYARLLNVIKTTGDKLQTASLANPDAALPKGLFTKELEVALLNGEADLAVHSLKDLPTAPVPGLALAGVPARGPTGDVWVSRRHGTIAEAPPGARVATGSMRRRAQLLSRRPDLKVEDLRGNIGTRLSKLDDDGLAGIILAEAGLRRLGLDAEIKEIIDPEWILPAIGQGALGLECRTDDAGAVEALSRITDPATRSLVLAERAMLKALGGGCLVPIGCLAHAEGDTGHRNRAIAHLLLNFGMVHDEAEAALDVYFRQCSVRLTCEDLATMAATISNMGHNPRTGDAVYDAASTRAMMAIMFTCGMYDYSGEWAYRVGVPAKSGVSGGVMAVVNRQIGIATYSPRSISIETFARSCLRIASTATVRMAISVRQICGWMIAKLQSRPRQLFRVTLP